MWGRGGGGGAWCSPVYTRRRPRVNRGGGPRRIPPRLSVCLSGLVVQSDGGDGNRTVRPVQRTRHVANLPGHLARLALFKQVPRRFVSCLVKCLTF